MSVTTHAICNEWGLKLRTKSDFVYHFPNHSYTFFKVEGAKFAFDTVGSVAIYRKISGNCHCAFAQQKYPGSLPLLPLQI